MTCDPTMSAPPSCDSKGHIAACCPADGVLHTGLSDLLCAPGYLVDQPCGPLSPVGNATCMGGLCMTMGP
jgi:hypothetical protein